ncbi:nSTAND1 domain-containing NTPase [Chitinophaga defluvii]|uniref:Novel STAND NTPase 1 domain-containing protein n=1 Tax=Chitinophaga defluvii TaxID=3163343 RepID=A0ABV2TAY9_9BACT
MSTTTDKFQSRYPGPVPFSAAYRELFFGREDDISQLISLIRNKQVTVLFGRSGFGKSSLINAGLCPLLEHTYFNKPGDTPATATRTTLTAEDITDEATSFAAVREEVPAGFYPDEKPYRIIKIRFEINPAGKSQSLVSQFKEQLWAHCNCDDNALFLSALGIPKEEVSAWQLFKTLQLQSEETHTAILLIMDQFEQVFDAPPKEFRQLAIALSEVLYNRMPAPFLHSLKTSGLAKSADPGTLMQLDFLEKGIPIRLLIGIRADKLYLLDDLGDDIPIIFNNRYRLKRLPAFKMDEVICNPATEKGSFASRPFLYTAEAVAKIKDYLTVKQNNKQEIKVETFLLQIICQHLEEQAMLKQAQTDKLIIIGDDDVKNLKDITKNYYKQIFSKPAPTLSENGRTGKTEKPFTPLEKIQIRYLIERKLINEKTRTRICLDKTFVYSLGFDELLLNKLLKTRIVRRELNTVSGESYELSHDAFIQPVLEASQDHELGDLRTAIMGQFTSLFENMGAKESGKVKQLLREHLLDKEGNLLSIQTSLLKSEEWDLLQTMKRNKALIRVEGIQQEGNARAPKTYMLNEVYQDAAISLLNIEQGAKQKRKYASLLSLAGAFLLMLIIIGIVMFKSWRLYYRERALNASIAIPFLLNSDTTQADEQLYALKTAYDQTQRDTARYQSIGKKLVDVFNANGILGTRICMPGKSVESYSLSVINDIFLVTYIDTLKQPEKYTLPGTFEMTPPPPPPNMNKLRDAALYLHAGQDTIVYRGVNAAGFVENAPYLFIKRKDSLYFYELSAQHPPQLAAQMHFRLNNNSLPKEQLQQLDEASNFTVKAFIPKAANREARAYVFTETGFNYTSCLWLLKAGGIEKSLCINAVSQRIYYNTKDSVVITTNDVNGEAGIFNYDLQRRQQLSAKGDYFLLTPVALQLPHLLYGKWRDSTFQIMICNFKGDSLGSKTFSTPWNNVYFDRYNHLVVSEKDSIRFLAQDLSIIKTIPVPVQAASSQVLYALNHQLNALFFNEALIGLYNNGGTRYSTTLPDAINAAWFSNTGDTVFAQCGKLLYILDKKLTVMKKLQNDAPFIDRLAGFKTYSYLLLADLHEKQVQEINSADAASISRWISRYKHPEALTDEQLKAYGLEKRNLLTFIIKLFL